MRYYVLVILLFWETAQVFPQKNNPFSREEYEKANTASDVTYLSNEEKEVVRQLNLARMDGDRYCNFYIEQYISYNNSNYTPKILPGNKYLQSLKIDAKKIKNLQLLYPDEKLSKASSFHAHDMGKAGITGHNSTDGTTWDLRIKRFFGNQYNISENCAYGFNNAIYIVGQLLIDQGVPSLGHRKNIFNPDQHQVGIGIFQHKIYQFNCVMDFYSGPAKQ